MGLTDSVARYAVRHAHVLVVEVRGAWGTRVAVEREVLSRGWRLAESPADADVLAVCGVPGPELSEAVDNVWEQMPGPRARADVASPSDALGALDRVAVDLADVARQHDDSRERAREPEAGEDEHAEHGDHGDHEDMDHEGHDGHGEHGSHEGMDHGHMHHGDMDMAPGGIPLAQGGDDRDGLEMDVLHVRLGPVLPAWPAGLVLRCTLQGDVIVEAEGSTVDGPPERPEAQTVDGPPVGDVAEDIPEAARTCDDVAGLLSLAGWQAGVDQARRTRDLVLDGDASADDALAQLTRRVRRARLLRWSLRGVRPLSLDELDRHGLPRHLEGDVCDRLLAMLDRARMQLADPAGTTDETTVSLDALPALVRGLDVATARLVVASLGLRPAVTAEGRAHV